MLIHNKTVWIYDIESFPNCFSCTCKNTETKEIKTFEISSRKNQYDQLFSLFIDSSKKLFCGYNNKGYDDLIMNYLIEYYRVFATSPYNVICNSVKHMSDIIVSAKTKEDKDRFIHYQYLNYFESMDLLRMMFSSKLRVGLKEMQITMFYPNVQEYDGNFDAPIPDSEIDNMIEYNMNDVNSTEELLYRLKDKGEIDVRLFMENEYGINALSMDSVKFGEEMLLDQYCKKTGLDKQYVKTLRSPMDYVPLKDVILPFIKYKNPILQDVLEEMRQQVVPTKKELIPKGQKAYEKRFYISKTRYSVGVGGIHSINTPEIFVPKEDEYIGHADVTSMYPSFIVQYGWVPRQLGKEFWTIYTHVYHERIEAKHSGAKTKSTALKLVLNSVTGKMQQEASWMYDPFTVFKIRINGQLVLLMLVDRLLALNCRIVQVNTDGVMYVAKRVDENRIQEAIHEVERLTKLGFETDNYEAFYQYAVNDYFGVKEGYSQSKDPKLIEKKGMFITEAKLGKGLAPLIIPKAVINYFLTKQDVFEFIKSDRDIRDFLMTQRVDRKFKVLYGDEPVVRMNRYYASEGGRYLYKKNKETGQVSNLLATTGVKILNKFDKEPIENRKINYRYYSSQARKIIENLVCRQLELF